MSIAKTTISTLTVCALAGSAYARDNVQVAGSSTVLPYASIVAEAFGENFDFPTPVVESGGSSSGLKRFCEGLGENTIDIANASRAIKKKKSRPALKLVLPTLSKCASGMTALCLPPASRATSLLLHRLIGF